MEVGGWRVLWVRGGLGVRADGIGWCRVGWPGIWRGEVVVAPHRLSAGGCGDRVEHV